MKFGWTACVLVASLSLNACNQGDQTAGTAGAASLAPGVAVTDATDLGETESRDYPIFDGTPDEFTVALADCLTTKGWKTVIVESAEGFIGFEIPGLTGDQNDEFMAADRACRGEIGVIDSNPDPMAIRAHFRHLLWAKDCLENLGYEISEPPSVQVFVESLGAAWSPHDDLSPGQEGWVAANRACPQDAATRERLLGEGAGAD